MPDEPRQKVTARVKVISVLLLVVAVGVIAAGVALQWRLTHVSSHPDAVARVGEERHLVKSVQKAAVDLLNRNDDTKAGDRLREMRKAFDEASSQRRAPGRRTIARPTSSRH